MDDRECRQCPGDSWDRSLPRLIAPRRSLVSRRMWRNKAAWKGPRKSRSIRSEYLRNILIKLCTSTERWPRLFFNKLWQKRVKNGDITNFTSYEVTLRVVVQKQPTQNHRNRKLITWYWDHTDRLRSYSTLIVMASGYFFGTWIKVTPTYATNLCDPTKSKLQMFLKKYNLKLYERDADPFPFCVTTFEITTKTAIITSDCFLISEKRLASAENNKYLL